MISDFLTSFWHQIDYGRSKSLVNDSRKITSQCSDFIMLYIEKSEKKIFYCILLYQTALADILLASNLAWVLQITSSLQKKYSQSML